MPDEHDQPDPAARPHRRSFTAEYKLAMVAEYDAADAEGRGALLRREGCTRPTSRSGAGPATAGG